MSLFILTHAFGFDSLRSKWNAPIFYYYIIIIPWTCAVCCFQTRSCRTSLSKTSRKTWPRRTSSSRWALRSRSSPFATSSTRCPPTATACSSTRSALAGPRSHCAAPATLAKFSVALFSATATMASPSLPRSCAGVTRFAKFTKSRAGCRSWTCNNGGFPRLHVVPGSTNLPNPSFTNLPPYVVISNQKNREHCSGPLTTLCSQSVVNLSIFHSNLVKSLPNVRCRVEAVARSPFVPSEVIKEQSPNKIKINPPNPTRCPFRHSAQNCSSQWLCCFVFWIAFWRCLLWFIPCKKRLLFWLLLVVRKTVHCKMWCLIEITVFKTDALVSKMYTFLCSVWWLCQLFGNLLWLDLNEMTAVKKYLALVDFFSLWRARDYFELNLIRKR